MLLLRTLHLLMLMFFFSDVENTCPSDILTLVPSEVIGEYGSEVPVNCSSADALPDEMYWKHGIRMSSLTEDESFTFWTLSLSDWNVTKAECMIKSESFECSEELPITLYKNPDMVSLYPTKYVNNMVEGTQYELQCDVIDVAPLQHVTVRWYKDDRVVWTESFLSNATRSPVSESSVYTFIVSREDDGARVRCEAQLDFGPNGLKPPVLSDTHVILVDYAPELSGTENEDVYVMQGNNATLTCDAKGNPPPQFHWSNDGGDLTVNTSYLNVTQVYANTTYVCVTANRVGTTTKHIHVHVYVREDVMKIPEVAMNTPEPPQKVCPLTVTPDKVVVKFGDTLTINCTTSATGEYFLKWSDVSEAPRIQNPPTFIWRNVKVEDWNIKPMCQIFQWNGPWCSVTSTITVYKSPDTVSLSVVGDGPMVEDTEHLLKCDITNVAPVQNLTVTWYRGQETVSTHRFNDTSETPVNVSSILKVAAKSDDDGVDYRCSAELFLGPEVEEMIPMTSSENYTAVVHYKPQMQHCPARYSGLERSFSLDTLMCKAKGNPPPTVHWYYQGKLVNTSELLTRNHSGRYTAEVVNNISGSSTVVDITVEYGPLFNCNSHYEVKENGKVQTLCDPEGAPTPTLSWFKEGNEMVPPQHWTKHDKGLYVLKAENEHGTANHKLFLDVLSAPEINKGNRSLEVTPGENVTLECQADGNPVPEVLWKYTPAANVRQTTGGRHKNIIVTGATSTNAGVYICVATNKVGTVSSSVTLQMKGQTVGGRLSFILWLLLLFFIIIFILLLVMLCRRRKKHRKYSFIPDKAKEGPDIPLTTKSDGTNI